MYLAELNEKYIYITFCGKCLGGFVRIINTSLSIVN